MKYITLVLLTCLLAGPALAEPTQQTKKLFVIVTTDEPVTQLMSMVLATQTLNKGATVDVLLCGEAGALALKGSQEIYLKPKNTSPQMLLKKLIEQGVSVEVCPPYLPNKDKQITDLIHGVSVAKPPLVADKLLDKDTQVLSY